MTQFESIAHPLQAAALNDSDRLDLVQQATREYPHLMLAAALAILRFRGCTTPAEDFMFDVLSAYDNCGPTLTPEIVSGHLEEFRDDFRDCVETARRFAWAAAQESV